MNYLTVNEIGIKWNITARMVTYYCDGERIARAEKKENLWLIPSDREKPLNKRLKLIVALEK